MSVTLTEAKVEANKDDYIMDLINCFFGFFLGFISISSAGQVEHSCGLVMVRVLYV